MNEEIVTLTIDGVEVKTKKGTTILQAAKEVGIDIPTLCFLKDINEVGDCRMCIVEVEGRKGFATSCIQTVEEGMVVHTHTPNVLEARHVILDLIISNHAKDCLTCTRSGNCELQNLAVKFNIQNVEFPGEVTQHKIDDKSPAIVRDFNKCILCRRCISTCKKVQDIGAIDCIERGFESCISTTYDHSLNDVDCTFCGQCIESCPTGALHEKESINDVWAKLKDPDTYVVVQTAPAVRVALGEEFGMPIGTNVKGKMVTALKRLGFDKVFDTNTGADLTIMEEANEFVERLQNGGVFPMITSCSPGWVRFAEKNFGDQLDHLSSCKSPHQMFGAIIKSYFAEKYGIDRNKICTVSVMPCIAKKYECSRPEMEVDGARDVDYVITTAIRTAVDTLENRSIDRIEYKEVRGEKGIKEATLNVAGKEVKIAVASGLANARKIMEQIRKGESPYHFVEIMACPGGCVMGGGQPIKSSTIRATVDVRKLRANALYEIDEKSVIRKSHESPVMKQLYAEFLEKPGSHLAHKYLHTSYSPKPKYDIE